MNTTIHYTEVYEDYQPAGWRWVCSCGAHSTKNQPTNKGIVKRGDAHQKRKHG